MPKIPTWQNHPNQPLKIFANHLSQSWIRFSFHFFPCCAQTPIFQISALSRQVCSFYPIKTGKHDNDTIGIAALSCNCVYFTIFLHNNADVVEFWKIGGSKPIAWLYLAHNYHYCIFSLALPLSVPLPLPLANSYYAGRWAISSVDKSVNHERELCAMSRERRRRTLRRWGEYFGAK